MVADQGARRDLAKERFWREMVAGQAQMSLNPNLEALKNPKFYAV